jgi:hypothetical protein
MEKKENRSVKKEGLPCGPVCRGWEEVFTEQESRECPAGGKKTEYKYFYIVICI